MTKGCVGLPLAPGGGRAQGHDRAQPGQRRRPLLHRRRQLKNTDENLARWIQNPQAIKKGVLMPNLGVTPEEAKSLVAYLRAHQ